MIPLADDSGSVTAASPGCQPAGRSASDGRRKVVILVATCAALLVVLFARRPEMFLRPQFWAEDGAVYFFQADTMGAHAIVQPYAGYYLVLLRLVAWVAAPFNAAMAPGIYFWACMAVMLGVATACFSPRIELSLRPVCVLALGLIPHTGEVVGNLTNLQWFTALGLLWLLLARDPSNLRQWATDSLLAVAVGLTGPFSLLFLPLFIARAFTQPTRYRWWMALLVAGTAAMQVRVMARSSVLHATLTWVSPVQVLDLLGRRLGGSLFLPAEWVQGLPLLAGVSLGVVVAVGLVAVAVWPGRQRLGRALLCGSILLTVGGTFFRLRDNLGQMMDLGLHDRYFYLPKLLMIGLLIQGMAMGGAWRRMYAASVLVVLAITLTGWRYRYLPDLHWATYAARIEAGLPTENIPINPTWTLTHPGRARPRD